MFEGKFYLFFVESIFGGTAWLSSVRVVKCNIKLFNERNLYYKFRNADMLNIRRASVQSINEPSYYL